jgi:antitoxin MazE
MEATIQKWGNSLGIRIPKNLANELHFNEGSNIEILLDDDRLIIVKKEKITLKEKLSMISSENLHHEIQSGEPLGNEEW